MRHSIEMEKLTLGVCYYPEHWDRALWKDDLQRMKQYGIEVIRLAEFSWALMEPEEGKYDFSFWDEFLALARLTLEKKLDVRFIEMMPIGLGKKFETIYNEDILEELKKQYPDIQEDRQIHGNGPAVYVKLPGGQGSVGFISALHGKFCQYCNRIRMTAQGCLKPCLCYGKGVELKDIFDRHEKPQRCGTTMADQETLEYLYQAITEAIQLKPKSHRFENLSEITEDKKMSQIGG